MGPDSVTPRRKVIFFRPKNAYQFHVRFPTGGFVDWVFRIAVHQVPDLIIAQLGGAHALSLIPRKEHSNQ
jgi:hypothetical protein